MSMSLVHYEVLHYYLCKCWKKKKKKTPHEQIKFQKHKKSTWLQLKHDLKAPEIIPNSPELCLQMFTDWNFPHANFDVHSPVCACINCLRERKKDRKTKCVCVRLCKLGARDVRVCVWACTCADSRIKIACTCIFLTFAVPPCPCSALPWCLGGYGCL